MARDKKKFRRKRQKPEFDQQLVDIRRVTRVVAGGRRMRFRVTMVIGDKKSRVGVGMAKGNDVSAAIEKAVNRAKKNMITVPVTENGSIPHEMSIKNGSARLFLRPAWEGTGIIAGGPVRPVFELAGIKNIFAKIYGTNNKLNNVTTAHKALSEMRSKEEIYEARDKELKKPAKKESAPVKKEAVKKKPATKKTTAKKTAKAPAKKKTTKEKK